MKWHRITITVIMAVFFLAAWPSIAGQPSFTTSNVFNGRMWQLMSPTQKTSYLTGIQEGIILCIHQIKQDLHIPQDVLTQLEASGFFDRRRLLFSSQGVVAIERRINIFYDDPANLQIPIMEAYRHVNLALNFTESQELQSNLSDLRRKYK